MVTCCEVKGCGAKPRCHVLARSACGRMLRIEMCGDHALGLAARAVELADLCRDGWHRLSHVADHPIAPECRHPESRWVDDRCLIDGLELLENIDELVGVPA